MIEFKILIKTITSISFLIIIFASGVSLANCNDAESEAYDGQRDAKRAYRSSDLNTCQSYARKAYRHASYAESDADRCNCNDAESEAYDGYRDAKRAYRSSNLNSCQSYARKAYRHLSYAESEASSCN